MSGDGSSLCFHQHQQVLWDVLKMFLQFNQEECHVLKHCGLAFTHPLLQATMKEIFQNTVAHNLSLQI